MQCRNPGVTPLSSFFPRLIVTDCESHFVQYYETPSIMERATVSHTVLALVEAHCTDCGGMRSSAATLA